MLPITLTMAAASALLALWLAVRVGRVRVAKQVMMGDGGDPVLVARMRAQANFVEYTPFVLILLALTESARGPHAWLWVVGIAYVGARILHAFGMDRPAPNPLRMIGTAVTMLTLLGLAGYALVIVYAGVEHAGVPNVTTL